MNKTQPHRTPKTTKTPRKPMDVHQLAEYLAVPRARFEQGGCGLSDAAAAIGLKRFEPLSEKRLPLDPFVVMQASWAITAFFLGPQHGSSEIERDDIDCQIQMIIHSVAEATRVQAAAIKARKKIQAAARVMENR